ncbi:MAG: Asp-tRNA(Asn)/Glu-tRNA(Gln) amidotransferase subunit GatB [Syntrophomonadaceae bacterium]
MNFQAVIGLEIHVEIKTKTKMFSGVAIDFSAPANTLVAPLDLAFPGTLPRVNEMAVKKAIQLADALHMEIARTLHFDRKNYFYSDLPKGYQITQDKHPLGRNGYLDLILASGEKKRIGIERLHLEEDTAMQHHLADQTLIDFNRAGLPLIEIVSYPELSSGEEAMLYVDKIREIVTYAEVSTGKMEEGSLRCDVNISLRPFGAKKMGTKVEIKNLNSIANIQRAIDYEIIRQQQCLLKGESIAQETRRYDEASRKTVTMRLKTDSVDYKYFPEANIIPIKLEESFIEEAIASRPELAAKKKVRFLEHYQLREYDADILLLSKAIAAYFDEAAQFTSSYQILANWLNGEVASYLNKNQIEITSLPIEPKRLAALINLIESGKISNKQGRQIFEWMLNDSSSPEEIANKHQLLQISDPKIIRPIVLETLQENPQSINDFKAGKDRALGFIVGQVMKKMRGRANPSIVNQIVNEEIRK